MDQINQVPAGGTPVAPEQNQPAQTPAQPTQESTSLAQTQTPVQSAQPTPSSTPSPTPLSELPAFTPKRSNVKLWVGVIGGILIVVIGAAMILGKTKTYKGSLTQTELEAERLAQQEAEKPPEAPPPPPPPPPPADTDESQVNTIKTNIINAALEITKVAEYVFGLASQYPLNEEIKSANKKAQDAKNIAAKIKATIQSETDIEKLNIFLNTINSTLSDVNTVKQIAETAVTKEPAVVITTDTDSPEKEILSLKEEIAKLQTELISAVKAKDTTEINKLKIKIGELNAEIKNLGGKPVIIIIPAEVPSEPATGTDCADPTFVYDPATKKCTKPPKEKEKGSREPAGKKTGLETKIDETGEHFLVAQAEMGVLKGLCDSTAGAQWNEAGIESGCVFEGINFKNLQAFKTKVDQIAKQAQASGQKSLSAASPESEAIATIAKIEDAARNAAEDAEYVAKLANQYPDNTEIQSANAKAQDAKATAEDAYGFAKGETDPAILKTLLSKAELAASKAYDAANAATNAADAADAEQQKEPPPLPPPTPPTPPSPTPAEEIADLKEEIADLKDQLDDAKNDNDKTLINKLIAEIAALNAKISSLGGQQVVVNVPEYKYPAAPESACADPSFVYDPFKKKCVAPTEVGASGGGSGGGGGTKKSVASAEGKKGAMETPEMWSNEVKTKTIETPEMWGEVTPTAAPKTGAKSTAYGATIQGKTGPGVLLYPVIIGAVNGFYYLARKRRKNNK